MGENSETQPTEMRENEVDGEISVRKLRFELTVSVKIAILAVFTYYSSIQANLQYW